MNCDSPDKRILQINRSFLLLLDYLTLRLYYLIIYDCLSADQYIIHLTIYMNALNCLFSSTD